MNSLIRNTMLMIACCLGASVQAQTILRVDDDAPLAGDGLSWATPHRHLQDALATAAGNPGVTEIRVAGGTYKPDQEERGIIPSLHRSVKFITISLCRSFSSLQDTSSEGMN